MPRKIKPKRPKWVPLTNDNKVIGATIRTNKRVMYQFVATITRIDVQRYGCDRIEAKVISRIKNNNWDNDEMITIYYTNYNGQYKRNKAMVFIDINNFQPEYHCKCASCGARKAKFTKGLCPTCNSKAI